LEVVAWEQISSLQASIVVAYAGGGGRMQSELPVGVGR
jgi:hypothetical protein